MSFLGELAIVTPKSNCRHGKHRSTRKMKTLTLENLSLLQLCRVSETLTSNFRKKSKLSVLWNCSKVNIGLKSTFRPVSLLFFRLDAKL